MTKIKIRNLNLQREEVKVQRERGCWCNSRNKTVRHPPNTPPLPSPPIIYKPTEAHTHHHFILNRVIQIPWQNLHERKKGFRKALERRLKPSSPTLHVTKWNTIIHHPQTNWQRKGWWWSFCTHSKLGRLLLLPYHFNNLHYHCILPPKWWEHEEGKVEFA